MGKQSRAGLSDPCKPTLEAKAEKGQSQIRAPSPAPRQCSRGAAFQSSQDSTRDAPELLTQCQHLKSCPGLCSVPCATLPFLTCKTLPKAAARASLQLPNLDRALGARRQINKAGFCFVTLQEQLLCSSCPALRVQAEKPQCYHVPAVASSQ